MGTSSVCWKLGWLLVLGGVLTATAADSLGKAERLLRENRPLVIAHRGYSAAAPENTLPAFQLALLARADMVELDYHHTKDGQLVVLHDFTLDRTTDARRQLGGTNLKVADFTFAALTNLDAGAWFGSGQSGVRVVKLTEALQNIQKAGVTLIERKAGDAAACVELLRGAGLVNEVVVQSFDWDYLADFHRREPRQILGALGPWKEFRGQKLDDADKRLSPRWVDEAAKVGARAVVWNREVTRDGIEHAHKLGLKVWCYTINDDADANELLFLGVDGIITDNPALIWKTLALRAEAQVDSAK